MRLDFLLIQRSIATPSRGCKRLKHNNKKIASTETNMLKNFRRRGLKIEREHEAWTIKNNECSIKTRLLKNCKRGVN